MNLFKCPPNAALTSIPANACPVRFDQVVRLMFQRIQASAFFDTTDILLQATWTAAISAVAGTKIVGSPLFSGLVLPVGEPIKEGGNDNSTIDGIAILRGLPFVSITGQFRNLSDAQIVALDNLTQESAVQPGETKLGVYMVNRHADAIARVDSTDVYSIPIYNFIVGDTASDGFNADNVTPFSFDLAPGWSRGVKVIPAPLVGLRTLPNS